MLRIVSRSDKIFYKCVDTYLKGRSESGATLFKIKVVDSMRYFVSA